MSKELKKDLAELWIKVSADQEDWKNDQKNAFDALAKNLQVAGFRKGKVPANVAKKHITEQNVFSKAIEKQLDKLVKVASKEIKEEMILDSPTYAIEKLSNEELEVKFIYPVYPEFKLPSYKNLDIKLEEKPVDEKFIDDEIKKIQKQQTMLVSKDGEIKKGDVVTFDFEGSVDGKVFEGGTSKDFQLEIGSGQFIPGFEDQMIGLKKGDKKDLKVTFPKDYHSEDLKGKEATFKVDVKEVKEKDTPKIDDELAKAANIPTVKTLLELKTYIKNVFTEQNRLAARQDFQKKAFELLKKDTKIPLPQLLVAKEMQNIHKHFVENMQKQGIDIKQFMKMTGQTEEAMMSSHRKDAESRLTDSLIFAEIAKLENIELTDKDYDEEYKKLAKVYGQDTKSIKTLVQKSQMQIPMTNDRVIDVLIKNAKK